MVSTASKIKSLSKHIEHFFFCIIDLHSLCSGFVLVMKVYLFLVQHVRHTDNDQITWPYSQNETFALGNAYGRLFW